MADDYYLIKGSTLTDMADAIREKDGTTETISASDMATRIQAIETAGKTVECKSYLTDSELSFITINPTDRSKCTISIETDAPINNLYSVSLNVYKPTSDANCDLFWMLTPRASLVYSSKLYVGSCGFIDSTDEGVLQIEANGSATPTFSNNTITINLINSYVFYRYKTLQGSMDWPSDGENSWRIYSVVVYD